MEHQDNYIANSYQYTDEELLTIFSEAKEIIPQVILEYQQIRDELITQMKAFRIRVKEIAVVENKDDFFIWFWGYAYLKYFHAPSVVKIDQHLYRLKKQKRLLYKTDNTYPASEIRWEELKEKAVTQPLSDIALPHLERVRQTYNRITALCPFHKEKTPSFTIFISQNTYHCFGCQAHGNVITFKMQIENLSFKDAVKELAR